MDESVSASASAASDLFRQGSRDEIERKSEALAPSIAEEHSLFLRFTEGAHGALLTVLRQLGASLSVADELMRFHRSGQDSLSTLSMFRYPKQESIEVGVGHNKHTDIGTLTFLLCQQWGLQVLSKDPPGWRFVAPRSSCAIINVGDTLRFLSGNRLRSAVHRVVPVGDLQREHRYSIAYFLRAENDAKFRDCAGRIVSAKSWHDEKFDVFRESHEVQEKASVLTGGMERRGTMMY